MLLLNSCPLIGDVHLFVKRVYTATAKAKIAGDIEVFLHSVEVS